MLKTLTIFFLLTAPLFALDLNKPQQAIMIDFETGEVLISKNADEKCFPSSMTKIMTAYIIFEKLENGELKLDDKLKVSVKAWRQEGSRMFLLPDTKVAVDELLRGLLVQSGNDAAITLAEGTEGSVENFVKLMNEKADELDMKNTNFTNPIGFSDSNHYMSVRDTAILSKKLIEKFPEYYNKYFSIAEYKYNKINQRNRNKLLRTYNGIDGIKTGFTELGGYGMATSCFEDNRRLIVVVNGLNKEAERSRISTELLDYGFKNLQRKKLYEKNGLVDIIPIKYGKKKNIELITKTDVFVSTETDSYKTDIIFLKKLEAPIGTDEILAILVVENESGEAMFHNLYSRHDVKKCNIFKLILIKILEFFGF